MNRTFTVCVKNRCKCRSILTAGPGGEETTAELESRVTSFDVAQWWEETKAVQLNRRVKTEPLDSTKLHNPYAGVHYAWQLTETIDDFLARLPPGTTETSDDHPWIFICNPYIRRKDRLNAQSQHSRGNEDEAPEVEGSQLDVLIEGGTERLGILLNFKKGIEKTRKAQSAMMREINKEKKEAIHDILALAHACKIRAGKVSVRRPFATDGASSLTLTNSGCCSVSRKTSIVSGE